MLILASPRSFLLASTWAEKCNLAIAASVRCVLVKAQRPLPPRQVRLGGNALRRTEHGHLGICGQRHGKNQTGLSLALRGLGLFCCEAFADGLHLFADGGGALAAIGHGVNQLLEIGAKFWAISGSNFAED